MSTPLQPGVAIELQHWLISGCCPPLAIPALWWKRKHACRFCTTPCDAECIVDGSASPAVEMSPEVQQQSGPHDLPAIQPPAQVSHLAALFVQLNLSDYLLRFERLHVNIVRHLGDVLIYQYPAG